MAAGRSEAERIDRAASAQTPRWAEELVDQIMALAPKPGHPGGVAGAGEMRPSGGQTGGEFS
jgi:hypothetical protein